MVLVHGQRGVPESETVRKAQSSMVRISLDHHNSYTQAHAVVPVGIPKLVVVRVVVQATPEEARSVPTPRPLSPAAPSPPPHPSTPPNRPLPPTQGGGLLFYVRKSLPKMTKLRCDVCMPPMLVWSRRSDH